MEKNTIWTDEVIIDLLLRKSLELKENNDNYIGISVDEVFTMFGIEKDEQFISNILNRIEVERITDTEYFPKIYPNKTTYNIINNGGYLTFLENTKQRKTNLDVKNISAKSNKWVYIVTISSLILAITILVLAFIYK